MITITSNRGLAGGYNSNIVKLITGHEGWNREDIVIYPIGSKGRDALSRSGYEIAQDWSDIVEEPASKLRFTGDCGSNSYAALKGGSAYLPVFDQLFFQHIFAELKTKQLRNLL